MRYLNWDVLIFPENSKVPQQEFRTQCGVIQDPHNARGISAPIGEYSSEDLEFMPLVATFIASLPEGSAFRLSLHSWARPEASQAARSLMGPDDTVLYGVRVYIDGRNSADTIFDSGVTWPHVIDTAIRSEVNRHGEQDSLRFPPFHQDMITNGNWNPADPHGRIRIIISETVMHAHSLPAYERVKDLVGFSFQHAPLPVLEASGISWPNTAMWQPAPRRPYPFVPSVRSRVEDNDHETHAHSPRRRAMAAAAAHREFERAVTHIDDAPLDPYARGLPDPPAFPLTRTHTMNQSVDMGDADLDPFVDHSDGTFARRLAARSDVSMYDASNTASTRVSSRNPSNQSRMSIVSQGIAAALGPTQSALYESVIDAFGVNSDRIDMNTLLYDPNIIPEGTSAPPTTPSQPMGRKLSAAAEARQASYAHATRVTSLTKFDVPISLNDIDIPTYAFLKQNWFNHRQDLLAENKPIPRRRDGVNDTIMDLIWERHRQYESMKEPPGKSPPPRDAAFDDVIIESVALKKQEQKELEAKRRQLAGGQIMSKKEGKKRPAETLEDGLGLEQRRASSGGLGLSANRRIPSLSRNTAETLGLWSDVKRKRPGASTGKELEADRVADRKENNDYSAAKHRLGARPRPRVRVSESGSPGSLVDDFDAQGVEESIRKQIKQIADPANDPGPY